MHARIDFWPWPTSAGVAQALAVAVSWWEVYGRDGTDSRCLSSCVYVASRRVGSRTHSCIVACDVTDDVSDAVTSPGACSRHDALDGKRLPSTSLYRVHTHRHSFA